MIAKKDLHFVLVAGEASGDILGAGLVKAIKQHFPHAKITGVAGPKMLAAGAETLFPMEKLSVMGVFDVLRNLPELLRCRRQVKQHVLTTRPDVFIGIDSPDFNLPLEAIAKKSGIPTVHYHSPSVWAWRQKRIYKIIKSTDLMLTLFPHEVKFYEKHGMRAKFVGHPLADEIPFQVDVNAIRKSLGLLPGQTYLALLPGSRSNEIKYLAPIFLQAAQQCLQTQPNLKIIVPMVNDNRRQQFVAIKQQLAPDLPLQIFMENSRDVIAAADVVMLASGTATLETLLLKKPMVVAYAMSALSFQIAKCLIKVKYIALPNILANERLVPEFIQHEASSKNIAQKTLHYLHDKNAVNALQIEYDYIHKLLRSNASAEAFDAVMSLIK